MSRTLRRDLDHRIGQFLEFERELLCLRGEQSVKMGEKRKKVFSRANVLYEVQSARRTQKRRQDLHSVHNHSVLLVCFANACQKILQGLAGVFLRSNVVVDAAFLQLGTQVDID